MPQSQRHIYFESKKKKWRKIYHTYSIHKKNKMVILMPDEIDFTVKHVTSDKKKDIYDYKRVISLEDIINNKPHIL